MTTSQTIDGVPRELIERAIAATMTARGIGSPTEHELRALLDAPESQSGKLPPVGRQAVWQAIDEALTGTVEPLLRGDIFNILARLLVPAPQAQGEPVALAVWYGSMPESNGKSNWTAILYRKGSEGSLLGALSDGITIDRSEYPERVRYEADRVRYLIGELKKEPWILDYDSDKHSGYVYAEQPAPVAVLMPERLPGDDGVCTESHYASGWNDCLDELKRLNHTL